MSPLNLNVGELIAGIESDLPGDDVMAKITEAQVRAHTLNALGDQLVGVYVAKAKQAGASWTDIGDAIGVSKQAAQQRWVPQTFERFTNRARHAVVLSQEAARAHKHNFIGTEHILLGLLGEPDGLAYQLLVVKAGSEDAVRQAVEDRLEPGGKKAPRGHIAFSTEGKQALEESIREGAELGHDFVGTEHLLLGLLNVKEGTAAAALGSLGLNLENTRTEVATEITRRLAEPKTNTD
jgi:Clp amino terminal domain, pathogenicity island component